MSRKMKFYCIISLSYRSVHGHQVVSTFFLSTICACIYICNKNTHTETHTHRHVVRVSTYKYTGEISKEFSDRHTGIDVCVCVCTLFKDLLGCTVIHKYQQATAGHVAATGQHNSLYMPMTSHCFIRSLWISSVTVTNC